MNNPELQNFLSHPQHWAGTEVHLKLKEATSVLHYSPLINRYFWRPTDLDKYCFNKVRLGRAHDLVAELVQEGWVIANA